MLPAGTSKDTESTAVKDPKRLVSCIDNGGADRAHSPTALSRAALGDQAIEQGALLPQAGTDDEGLRVAGFPRTGRRPGGSAPA